MIVIAFDSHILGFQVPVPDARGFQEGFRHELGPVRTYRRERGIPVPDQDGGGTHGRAGRGEPLRVRHDRRGDLTGLQ